jgi:hypothetical protein
MNVTRALVVLVAFLAALVRPAPALARMAAVDASAYVFPSYTLRRAADLSASAEGELIGDVIALARGARHGSRRLLLPSVLERPEDPRARAALMERGTAPELTQERVVIVRHLERAKR